MDGKAEFQRRVRYLKAVAQVLLAMIFGCLLAFLLYLDFADPDLALDPLIRWVLILLVLVLLGLADVERLLPPGRNGGGNG